MGATASPTFVKFKHKLHDVSFVMEEMNFWILKEMNLTMAATRALWQLRGPNNPPEEAHAIWNKIKRRLLGFMFEILGFCLKYDTWEGTV